MPRYLGLKISDDHPGSQGENFFERMAGGERFRLYPCLDKDALIERPDDPTDVVILSVRTTSQKKTGLLIEMEIRTPASRGFKRGKYTLEFDEFLLCHELPEEMFKDE